ncbi:DUF2628 domain-containing protein [Brucella gallinifaecis]|uniref:DUF2628 domain-containing protein n=1 Tax=Brucella gallinifaecis TaxID=215590 RepID=A0A502BHT3_9HYPH|nr:DUF2628 domain-containing protein [Brucella gallinifaecis]TPF74222.1 DUF2628 domain-containing protein [Brucella gallinifaecis]
MAQFVVLQKEGTNSAEDSVFVRDGFYTLALILPVVWLFSQRLWFEAFAVLGITILLGFAGSMLDICDAVPLITLLFSLFVALEGANWKIARLKRQGYVEKAAIDASDLEEAEIRYFCALEDAASPVHAPAPEWAHETPRPTYSSFGSTIGFVGHRGEN